MSDWGPLPVTELPLPTGRVAKVCRPALSVLAASGRIPNPILGHVLGAAGRGESMVEALSADAAAFFGYKLHMVKAALVEPQVYLPDETPAKGAVPIANLTEGEIEAIWDWVSVGEEALAGYAGFRDEPAGAAPGGDGGALRSEAE